MSGRRTGSRGSEGGKWLFGTSTMESRGGGSWRGGMCGFRLQVLVHYVLSHWALTQKHTLKEILTKDFKVVNREQKTPSAGPF